MKLPEDAKPIGPRQLHPDGGEAGGGDDQERSPQLVVPQRELVDFVNAALELAGVGIELAGETEEFSHPHTVCRHCGEETPGMHARCSESLRQGLAAGSSRLCSRGHRMVGYEGGLRVIMPKTMTVTGGATRRPSAGGSDRLDRFLNRLRGVAGWLAPADRHELPSVATEPVEVGPEGIPGAFLDPLSHMRDPLLISMARSLVAAIDAKDRYTRGHSERVQIVSSVLGEALELDEATANDLYWASLLHDMGKIGVPDAILTKRRPLTSKEWKAMQKHPALGAEMLEPLEWLAGARPGIRHHHERIDGGGYPDGLKGDRIPLVARIIAVADTFDAMISRRHYRPECNAHAALEEMIEVAGSQLDLNLVAIFEGSFDRICEQLAGASYLAEGLLRQEDETARAA